MSSRELTFVRGILRGTSPFTAVAQAFSVRIALLFVNLGTGVITARVLGPDGRGDLTAISLWPVLLAGVATFGFPAGLAYESRRYPDRAMRNLTIGLLTTGFIGILTAGIGVTAMPSLLSRFSPETITYARWLMLFTPQILLLNTLRAYYSSNQNFRRVNSTFMWPPLTTLVCLATLAHAHSLSFVTAAWSYYLPPAVLCLVLLVHLRKELAFRTATLFKDLTPIFSYGIRAYGLDLIISLSTQIDQALILGYLSAGQLGLYSVAFTLSRLITIVHQSVTIVIFTSVIGLSATDTALVITRTARLSNLLAIACGIMFLAVAPVIIPVVYGRAYAEVFGLTGLLTIEALLAGTTSILQESFATLGRPLVVTLIQGTWLAITILLLLALVPRLGLQGAAVALIISSLVRLTVVVSAYRLILHLPLPRFIPDSNDFAYLQRKFHSLSNSSATTTPSER